jgi:hypothetical protein
LPAGGALSAASSSQKRSYSGLTLVKKTPLPAVAPGGSGWFSSG